VKQGTMIVLLFCLAAAAYANPIVFDPVGSVASAIVLGSAVVIEAGIVTLILLFWGIEPKPVYMALIVGNSAVYFLIFLPLVEFSSKIWIAEAVIVGLDAVLIKIITHYDIFCGDTFRLLKWRYAFIIAAIGNLVSYYVGVVMNG
jgi:hypothetical protein